MWAVLTGPLGADRRWDPEAFFRTGVDEIDAVLARVAALGGPAGPGRALDFGCGLGRLTQPLARRFGGADGVDIAEGMIRRARELNRAGDACRYHLNERDDLAVFADGQFDFVYSSIVLQHMEPRYSERYIREFFRLLAPGGIAVFQIPAEPAVDPAPRSHESAPLPPEACRASIEAPRAIRSAPGARVPLIATVRNLGPRTWRIYGQANGAFSVRLGNHWRSGWLGRMRTLNDRRAELPHDVQPGEEVEMELPVEAPAAAGRHTLELDMVQEDVRWFAWAGSRPLRIRFTVDPQLTPGTVEGISPRMEMFATPRARVEAIVAEAGGVLVAVDRDDSPGPGWTSYRYFAKRRS